MVTVVLFLSMPISVSATTALQDVWGIATDPLKLGKASSELSASLERTMAQLAILESQTNYDVRERLEQIRRILKDVVIDAQSTVAEATRGMFALEAAINADAIKLIYAAQCATEVALMDQFQRSFAQLITNLKKADPSVTILGVRILSLNTNDVQIDQPDQAYISAKTIVFNNLNDDKKVNDDSKAYDILSAYQNLERAARFTRCHYINQRLETRWVEEVNELERLSLPWVTIVSPTM
jgi:hypothetical protein